MQCKIYILLLILLSLTSCNVTPTLKVTEVSGRIAILNKNEPAPYRGILLTIDDFYILENKK